MTATANLSALRAAAAAGEGLAMLALADVAEEGAPGWEYIAWALIGGTQRGRHLPHVVVWDDGLEVRPAVCADPWIRYRWAEADGRWHAANVRWQVLAVGVTPPPWVRDAVLSACREALAG